MVQQLMVSYCENQLTLFDLSYREAVAVVTDTVATMIAAGHVFVQSTTHLRLAAVKGEGYSQRESIFYWLLAAF